MELSDKTIKESGYLIKLTKDFKSANFYYDIFNLLKSELDFLHNTNLMIIDDPNENAYFDTEENNLCINPEENYYYALNLAYNTLDGKDKIDYAHYLCYFIILHEVTHSEQRACYKEDYSIYPEINHLYRNIYERNTKYNLWFKYNYCYHGDTFAIERNANLNAYRIINELVKEEYQNATKLGYIKVYFTNYYKHKEKIINPAHQTMKMMGYKYNIISDGIPVEERIIHGLDITIDEYQKYIGIFDDKEVNTSTYDEIQRLLKP